MWSATRMELRQLKTFCTVAQHLSFTRAADALGYAQSSVTAQVRALETELGVRLFDRLGRTVSLTDAGSRLLDYAVRLLDLADEAHVAVSETGEPSGQLVVSAPETLSTYRLPPLLKQYRAQFPAVQLIMRSFSVAETLTHLKDGQLDAAVLLTDPLPQLPGISVAPFLSERLLLLASPQHPLAHERQVEAEDLRSETFLLTEAGCTYRAAFEKRLLAQGVQLTTTMEFSSVEAIKQCVMANLGLTLLPEVAVCREVEQGRLVALESTVSGFEMATCMVWNSDKWLSAARREFIHMAQEVLHPAPLPA